MKATQIKAEEEAAALEAAWLKKEKEVKAEHIKAEEEAAALDVSRFKTKELEAALIKAEEESASEAEERGDDNALVQKKGRQQEQKMIMIPSLF